MASNRLLGHDAVQGRACKVFACVARALVRNGPHVRRVALVLEGQASRGNERGPEALFVGRIG